MTHRVLKTVQLGLVIAAAAVLAACSGAAPDVSNGRSAEELIQGTWIVTKYEVTYDILPDHPVDLAESSDIVYRLENGSYSSTCFPACAGIVRAEYGEYTVIEERKSLRMVTLNVDLEPEFERFRSDYIGAEFRGTYSFPSRDRIKVTSRLQQLYQGTFIQAKVVIEGQRGSTAAPASPAPVVFGSTADRQTDPFDLNSAEVSGNILTINVSFSGGCRNHVFTLTAATFFLVESFPVQLPMMLTHDDNDDSCEAYPTEQRRFDLTPIKERYRTAYGQDSGTVRLLLQPAPHTDQPLVYEF